MPLPSDYNSVFSLTPLALLSRSLGDYTSDAFDGVPGSFSAVGVSLWVYVSSIIGSPTVDCELQVSSDGTTWRTLAGSEITTLTSVGNALSNAAVFSANYVRVASLVGGSTGSSATYQVIALLSLLGT